MVWHRADVISGLRNQVVKQINIYMKMPSYRAVQPMEKPPCLLTPLSGAAATLPSPLLVCGAAGTPILQRLERELEEDQSPVTIA